MNATRSLWRGEVPIREAFWSWLVLRGLLLNAGCTLGALAIVGIAPDNATPLLWLAVLLHLAAIPYNLVCLMGVWRSAARTPGDGTTSALKVLAVLLVVAYLVV